MSGAELIKPDLQWSLMALGPRQTGESVPGGSSLSFTAVDPENSEFCVILNIHNFIALQGY